MLSRSFGTDESGNLKMVIEVLEMTILRLQRQQENGFFKMPEPFAPYH